MGDILQIGESLKKNRTMMGLSLGDVSEMTGVSKTMLSQIENGVSTPTITTVWKIANGLKLKFESLLSTDTCEQYEVKSIENMEPLTDDDNRIQIYCLFPFSPLSGMEFYYSIIKPGCNYASTGHATNRASTKEYLIVSKGSIELVVGSSTYPLKEGNAIVFDGSESHRYINNSDEDAVVLFINYYL